MISPVLLTDRAVIAVSGEEAAPFLQGLVTNDAAGLGDGKAMYAALLTPQGKLLFDFLVVRRSDAFLLDCMATTSDALIKRLFLYRLRSKVTIERRVDLGVFVAQSVSSLPLPCFTDPRLAALGWRAIASPDALPGNAEGMGMYLAHRLDCGVPEGPDFGQDKIFALDADLDELHGVSFEKGCYVGQELTARMKHRGTARKRVLPVATTDGGALAESETSLRTGTQELGTVLSTYGSRGFVLVRLDRLAEAQASDLNVAGTSVSVAKPAWLFA